MRIGGCAAGLAPPPLLSPRRPWFHAPPVLGCRSSPLDSGHAGCPEPCGNMGGVLWVPPRPCRAALPMTPFRPYTCMCNGRIRPCALSLPARDCCCGSRISAMQTACFVSVSLFPHSPWPPLSGGESSVRCNARQSILQACRAALLKWRPKGAFSKRPCPGIAIPQSCSGLWLASCCSNCFIGKCSVGFLFDKVYPASTNRQGASS